MSVLTSARLGVLAGTVALITASAAWADSFVRIQGDQFAVNGQVYKIKGSNYYPRNHMWGDMWSSFDINQIAADAQRMHDLGLNAVRILVPYSNGGWNGPNVPASKLLQLDQVVDTMGDHGIRSVVTLFDWETTFPAANTATESDHYKYVNAIADRLKSNPYVLMWDVKNEPDHPDNYGDCDCSPNPGSCGNWDCNPTKRNQIVSWLGRMCNAVRARDPNHPASAGIRWWQNLSDVLSFEDVAIFHSYWPNISQEISETKTAMGSKQKPILVEEWGWPTNPNPCNRSGQVITSYNETEQLNVYTNHLSGFTQGNVAGGLQWMTFDAQGYTNDPNQSFEQYFGLWKYDYTLKPAGVYYRDHYSVTQFPPYVFPPGTVSGLTASTLGMDIVVTWTNPTTWSFSGTMIRYSTQGFPASPTDGTLLCDLKAAAGTSGSFRHDSPRRGVTYYSAFAYNVERTYGTPITTSQTVVVKADFDGDGDVDMADFAHLQVCMTGEFIPQTDPSCLNARLDSDSDVDNDDMAIFLSCFTGPGAGLPAGCGH